MRASRLVSLLLLLQTRGQLTAAELADRFDVSIRTIHRDVEALGDAGVPIEAVRGPAGGYRLARGYRTRLTGLTAEEAEALFAAGIRSEEHTSELQSRRELVCRLLLEKKKSSPR